MRGEEKRTWFVEEEEEEEEFSWTIYINNRTRFM